MSSGVILVGAAGNESYKIDISTGEDYNNSIDILGDISGQVATIKVYYHRGASPTSAGDFITVGAIDYTKGGSLTRSSYSESESMTKAFFSNTGPRVDIYAPGGRIAGAVSSSYSKLNWVPYYLNTSYKSVKMDGTSQASPQVTGVLACALQSNTTLTQGSAKQWLIENSKAKISDSGTNTYTNLFNLQGASNRYLYMPYTYRTTNLTPSMKGGSTTITGPGVSF
jgi:hypothetical protein